MKLKALKSVLFSYHGDVQWAIVWDAKTAKDLETDCTIDYAMAHYGECELTHILAENNHIVLSIIAE